MADAIERPIPPTDRAIVSHEAPADPAIRRVSAATDAIAALASSQTARASAARDRAQLLKEVVGFARTQPEYKLARSAEREEFDRSLQEPLRPIVSGQAIVRAQHDVMKIMADPT